MEYENMTFEVIPKNVIVHPANRGVQVEQHPMYKAIDLLSIGEKLVLGKRAELEHAQYERLRQAAKKRADRVTELSKGKKKFKIYTGLRPSTAAEKILVIERTA